MLAQAFPSLSSAQIVQLLLSTATDAGATGPDALYGAGILDVARAFQPQGQLSLAGTGVAVSTGTPTLLSSAMGDAKSAGLATVALDSYNRAFSTDLSLGTYPHHAADPWGDAVYPNPSAKYGRVVTTDIRSERRMVAGFDDYPQVVDVADQLLRRGYADEDVRGILGENYLRLFEATWR